MDSDHVDTFCAQAWADTRLDPIRSKLPVKAPDATLAQLGDPSLATAPPHHHGLLSLRQFGELHHEVAFNRKLAAAHAESCRAATMHARYASALLSTYTSPAAASLSRMP